MRSCVLVASALALLVGGSGCTDDGASGVLVYEGSSTIGEGAMPGLAEAFERRHGVRFEKIGLKGSGEGAKQALAGGVVGGVSRDLTADERGRHPYYRIIGYDAIAVFVHQSNPVVSLTRSQLKGIFTGKIKNWREVGGRDASIVVVTELKNGTRATIAEFREMALDGAEFGPGREVDRPVDCVRQAAAEPTAITHAAAALAVPGARTVAVDGVEPAGVGVVSGAYPLGRPLILLYKTIPTGDAKRFFDFALSPEGQAIVARKFVPVR